MKREKQAETEETTPPATETDTAEVETDEQAEQDGGDDTSVEVDEEVDTPPTEETTEEPPAEEKPPYFLDGLLNPMAFEDETVRAEIEKFNGNYRQQQLDLVEAKKSFAIDKELLNVAFKSKDDALKFIDTSKITVDEKGVVVGLNEQVEELRKTKGYLFLDQTSGFNPAPPTTGKDISKMSLADAILASKKQ